MKRVAFILGNLIGALAVAGFCLMLFSVIESWLHRHENPEGIVTPMGYATLSLLFALVGWRLSSSRRHLWVAVIGATSSVIAIGVESVFYR